MLNNGYTFFKVDGGYGPWSEYGSCSVTCGEGVQERKRICDHPIPQFAGLRCDQLELGPDSETKSCKMENCPGELGCQFCVSPTDVNGPTQGQRKTLTRSWVQFPSWSEFFSVLVWAHFHQ